MLALLIALACSTPADTDTDTDTDTGAPIEDTDTGDTEELDPDPMGLVGSWLVTPCPCDVQPSQGDCAAWANDYASQGWDGVSYSPALDIMEDGTGTLMVTVYWHGDDGVEQTDLLEEPMTWSQAGGVYTVNGIVWHVEHLGELLTVTCGEGAHSLVP